MTRKKDRCPKDSSQVTALCNKINEMASSMWPFICQAIQTTEKIFFTHKVLFTDLCIITTSYSLKQWKQYAIPLGSQAPSPLPHTLAPLAGSLNLIKPLRFLFCKYTSWTHTLLLQQQLKIKVAFCYNKHRNSIYSLNTYTNIHIYRHILTLIRLNNTYQQTTLIHLNI